MFIEFLEALVACILFRVPDPYVAPEAKVERAIMNYVLPKANARARWKKVRRRDKGKKEKTIPCCSEALVVFIFLLLSLTHSCILS